MDDHNIASNTVGNLKEQVSKDLDTVSRSKKSDAYRGVELFFSFDIVNSSSYKESNQYDWPLVLQRILDNIQNQVLQEFDTNAILWRVIGDELIFAVPIAGIDRLHENVKSIFKIVATVSRQLKKGSFFKIFFPEEQFKHLYASNTLDIKAAAWIAIVSRYKELEEFENLSVFYERPENQGNLQEFLGPDIDAGFRVKQYTKAGRLAVSFELARLLSERTESLGCLHIMSYQHLKGVWHGQYYPIIWYYFQNFAEGLSFNESFRYDERATDKIVCEYLERDRLGKDEVDPESKIAVCMYYDVIYAIQKLEEDHTLGPKIRAIKDAIEEANKDSQSLCVKNLFDDDSLLKMHFAVVCYNPNLNAVLIAKRSDEKTFLPGCWEFGCVKAIAGNDLIGKIEEEYKRDFQIEIKLVTDSARKQDMQPIPLAIYSINQNNIESGATKKKEIGLILLAEITSDFRVDHFQATRKHSDVKWIQEDEVDGFNESAVPDFKDTLKKAFAEIRVRFQRQTEDETDGKR